MADRLVGNKAPDFKMKIVKEDGNTFDEVCLNDYKGKWLVLFFYPLDFTFVWPTEITGFSDKLEEFEALNASILAVSTDSIYSHKAWIATPRDKFGIENTKYPLASDITHNVSRDYGVYLAEEGISIRGLFIIDPEGLVKYQVVHDLGVGRSAKEVLRVLRAMQNGGLCPLDWEDDDDTLKF